MIRRPPRSTLFPTRRSSDLLRVCATPAHLPHPHGGISARLPRCLSLSRLSVFAARECFRRLACNWQGPGRGLTRECARSVGTERRRTSCGAPNRSAVLSKPHKALAGGGSHPYDLARAGG